MPIIETQDVTGWCGDNVTLHCSVEMNRDSAGEMDRDSRTGIIWVRHSDNNVGETASEIIAHDQHILKHSDNSEDLKFIAKVRRGKKRRKLNSSLTVSHQTLIINDFEIQ